MKMKRVMTFILVLGLIVSMFAACHDTGTEGDSNSAEGTDGNTEFTESNTESVETTVEDITEDTSGAETESSGNEEDGEETKDTLDGKKVIFIGNSHTYYGKTVIEKSNDTLTQAERSNDKGYFYQICKENGEEVSVTNWTFGNHTFKDFFTVCDADRACDGKRHQDYLVDRYFDYVVMQQGTGEMTAKEFHESVKLVTDVFKTANPDVKFVFLTSRRVYEKNLSWISELKTLEDQGFIIADWGRLVDDVITGATTVPNATQNYNQNSFIISKSASDGYHPNMLTGYITSLMTYCAITGESAVGQDYDFCGDTSVNSKFSFSSFISKYYIYNGATTNFKNIFASEADMRGIQELIDTYLREKEYRN